MKKTFILLLLTCLGGIALAQENIVTITGGYSFGKPEDSDLSLTGWRINGTYEFNPTRGPWAFGISIGYIGLSGTESGGLAGATEYKTGTMPIYFSPKYMFGSEKIKGFIKGAIGTHNTRFTRTALVEITDNDWGFYAGGSAGLNFSVSENVFLTAEYELGWLSNASYKDGLINSVLAGIGFRF